MPSSDMRVQRRLRMTPPPTHAAAEHATRKRRPPRRFAVLIVLALALGALVATTLRSESDRSDSSSPSDSGAPTSQGPTSVQLGTAGSLPFSPTSFWNTRLPEQSTLSPDSDDLVRAFNKQWKTFYGTVGINTDDYSIPIYTVPASQPTVRVSLAPGCHSNRALTAQLRAVPIPPDAHPANGDDHSLVIWQPATDTAWELWITRKDAAGSWSACWGGRIRAVSTSRGVFPVPFGVAASGLSYLAGAIKVSELQSGEIKHALVVAVVHTKADAQVPPAVRNDGNSNAADAIPEGTRFRLDPTIDVATLGLSPVGATIALALQRYGMVVADTSGAVVLIAEDGQSYVAAGQPDPYTDLFGDQASYEVLAKIPWSRLQVVQSNA
jgi:hypothetical protein